MTWLGDVDAAREYLARGGGKRPTRKVVYLMVRHGLKVARLGDTGRRMLFAADWIDQYLLSTAEEHERETATARPLATRRAS